MLQMTCAQFMAYLRSASELIAQNGEGITALDAAIADGDHWLNLHNGFMKLLEKEAELAAAEDFRAFFQKLAMETMSAMGGASGALYGSAYLAAAKELEGVAVLDEALLGRVLGLWARAFMKRGNAKPGDKTMVDAMLPAARAYQEAIDAGFPAREALAAMKRAAKEGAESTREMEAAKGRASNQPGKGAGHLDPGAVTLAMQLGCLADTLAERCLRDDPA